MISVSESLSDDYKHAAVFVDYGGTLVGETRFLNGNAEIEMLCDARIALGSLKQSGYQTILKIDATDMTSVGRVAGVMQSSYADLAAGLAEQGVQFDRICGSLLDKSWPAAELMTWIPGESGVDLERSWLIGDKSTDIALAHASGLKSILVETGNAGLDQEMWAQPDFIVPGLCEAIDYILVGYPKAHALCLALAARMNRADFVAVGGLSRSGKSTFASALCFALRERGHRAWVVSIDGWLRDREQRMPTVFGRYDLFALHQLIRKLESRELTLELELPSYNKLEQRSTESVHPISVLPDDIVILEGTIALALAPASGKRVHRFFVSIDEVERERRVIGEYLLRGKTEAEARAIYEARQLDETPQVISSASDSTHVHEGVAPGAI